MGGSMKKKSWIEKLNDSKDLPRIVKITAEQTSKKNLFGLDAGDTMVIPSPLEVNELMKKVRKGKLITINEIRKSLARKYGVTTACPLTTGIFAWISVNTADEEKNQGKVRITPYWRTLKVNGEINPKYPGGVKQQIKLLQSEGFEVIKNGEKFFVKDYEKYLMNL